MVRQQYMEREQEATWEAGRRRRTILEAAWQSLHNEREELSDLTTTWKSEETLTERCKGEDAKKACC